MLAHLSSTTNSSYPSSASVPSVPLNLLLRAPPLPLLLSLALLLLALLLLQLLALALLLTALLLPALLLSILLSSLAGRDAASQTNQAASTPGTSYCSLGLSFTHSRTHVLSSAHISPSMYCLSPSQRQVLDAPVGMHCH
mgnify:CR=1 FL=1